MTNKAYIVANKKQELDVLKKFEQKGLLWRVGRNATDFVPSENDVFNKFASFPYAIIEKEFIIWSPIEQLEDETIVYDGRKGEKMYKVTQGFMNELIKWRDEMNLNAKDKDFGAFVNGNDIQNIPDVVFLWWRKIENSIEPNNRLIAIIQWLNGEDVFEVEAPHKFVVRNGYPDKYGDYNYVIVNNNIALHTDLRYATKFDTREEAQEWANSHQVVVEIDAEGNEVE